MSIVHVIATYKSNVQSSFTSLLTPSTSIVKQKYRRKKRD